MVLSKRSLGNENILYIINQDIRKGYCEVK